ncbi:MAG: glycosyltransferase family 39 protein, partial [Dongiaceae bacterium]
MAAAAFVAAALLGRACFPYLAFDPDSAAYLFEARLMAQGRIAAPAPPEFGFSPSPHIDIYGGLWFAKYPFGTSLMLVPGVLAGAPWLMPALATGLTLLLFFGIVRALYDDRVAALALLLAVLSPTTLPIGASLLSQPASRLCMAAFLWGLLRMLRAPPGRRRQLWAALAGLALGYGFDTRPLVAVVFGVLGAGLVIAVLARRPDRAGFVRPAFWAAAPWLAMVGLHLAWNAALTGQPLLSTYHVLQHADRMGFGLRGEGYAPFVRDFRLRFTPGYAFVRIWVHTLPCVLFNTLGWGAYDPAMLFPRDP